MLIQQLSLGIEPTTYNDYYKCVISKIKQKEIKDKIEFANTILVSDKDISFLQFSKHLNDNKFNIGRNRLFKLLRKNKILMCNNIPYQQYVDRKYFTTTETIVFVKYQYVNLSTTMITPLGQMWIINNLELWRNNKS